jgi:hypothetical protein
MPKMERQGRGVTKVFAAILARRSLMPTGRALALSSWRPVAVSPMFPEKCVGIVLLLAPSGSLRHPWRHLLDRQPTTVLLGTRRVRERRTGKFGVPGRTVPEALDLLSERRDSAYPFESRQCITRPRREKWLPTTSCACV